MMNFMYWVVFVSCRRIKYYFPNALFLQLELKGGYIDLSDIRTTQFEEDRESQDFLFLEQIIAIGGIFRL